jgi:gluconolactonase
MPRLALDLTKEADRQKVNGVWRRALGWIPGEPNQGLVAETAASPARLADYDDSGWEITDNLREGVSTGLTFGWWRMTIELPEEVEGQPIAGAQVFFETNIDDYGEVWIDGQIDLVAKVAATTGSVTGFNQQQRVPVTSSAVPGGKHVIACLAINGPLGAPGGGIFIRYATLAFESRG